MSHALVTCVSLSRSGMRGAPPIRSQSELEALKISLQRQDLAKDKPQRPVKSPGVQWEPRTKRLGKSKAESFRGIPSDRSSLGGGTWMPQACLIKPLCHGFGPASCRVCSYGFGQCRFQDASGPPSTHGFGPTCVPCCFGPRLWATPCLGCQK